MTGREPKTVRLDPEVWSEFVSWVVETEGQKHGELGRHVENALSEYIDHGREARIEEKVDEVLARLSEDGATHTRKHTPAGEKVQAIADDLRRLDQRVIPADEVRRAIETTAGADDRTVDKYHRLLKRHGLAYEHPSDSNVWTVDRDDWIGWVTDYVDNNPTAKIRDVVDVYPIEIEEFDRLATDVERVTA